jgi:hypothetical protein
MIKNTRLRLLIFGILMLFPGLVFAQDRDDGKNIEIHGFLMGNYSLRTHAQKPDGKEGDDFLLAEERFRLDIFGWTESIEASIRFKGDLLYDHVANELDTDTRELYLDYTTGDFDLRLGRQIVTWGVGDLLFINDIFPKDYVAFFSGRPLEYLKIGSDALKISLHPDIFSAELVVIPFFEPNHLPTQARFLLFDPFPQIPHRETDEPDTEIDNTQIAIRIYRNIWNVDISFYAYKGFFGTPAMRPDHPEEPTKIISFFPKLSTYGLSLQGGWLGGVVSVEGGYYDSREDRDGTEPFIPNSLVKYLVGYQRQLWKDFTIGIQYYDEFMAHHDKYVENLPPGSPVLDEHRDLITVRLTQFLKHRTLKLSLFTFYSPNDEDYMIIPEAKYNFTDDLSVALGGNIFGGDEDALQFGQFDLNDNIYTVIKYEF